MKKSTFKLLTLSWGIVAATSIISCGKDKKEDEEAATEEEAGGSPTGGTGSNKTLTEVTSIGQLNLSSVLKIKVPDSISKASASSAGLVATGKKSREACEVSRNVKEGLQQLNSIGGMFCHLEIESAKMTFGKKYKIKITGQEKQDMAIWVDNSKAADGSIKVSMCNDGKLKEVFEVSGVKGDAAKGSLITRGSETYQGKAQSWENEVKFDMGYTVAGKSFMSNSGIFTNGTDKYMRHLVLDLSDSGVSKVFVSNSGTHEGQQFYSAGAARSNKDFGQVLYKNKGTNGQDVFDWTHRAFYSAEGYVVAENANASFASGKDLFVLDAEVPQFLPSTFKVAAFAASEWDCKTEAEVAIDMSGATKAKHDACNTEWDKGVECWSEEFQESEKDHDIDESEQKKPEDLDDISEIKVVAE
ncbi:hypothetical protein MEO40_06985 [Dolichospermum sp. ST_sed1]|nr:hypothetical protein [Dolichospermum sp. ST_sed1]